MEAPHGLTRKTVMYKGDHVVKQALICKGEHVANKNVWAGVCVTSDCSWHKLDQGPHQVILV